MENMEPGYWAVLPATIRYDPQLPAAAKILYAEISSLTHQRGYCYAENAYFTGLYGMAERTLQRYLKALEAGGYIRILDGEGGHGRRKIYAGINPLANPDKNDRMNPDKNDGVTPTKMTGLNNNKNNNTPPIAPQGAGADYEPKKEPAWKPDRFAAFWQYYPLHTSKQPAIRAWDRLKPSDELLAVIGKALRRQIAEARARAERENRPFEWRLYASTYLNNARWTDEAGERAAAAPGKEREEEIEWEN